MSVETKRFIETMRPRFRHEVIDGHRGIEDPWVCTRALRLAHAVVSQADMLEVAQEGLGVNLLKSFDGDIPEICPPWPPWPIPPIEEPEDEEPWPDPEPIGPEIFGAALVFAAKYSRNEEIRGLSKEIGQRLVG